MAQTFTSTDVVTTTNVFADNQSQRTNENTLRSSFSGSSQPSDPVVGQVWYDTTNSKQMQYNGTGWVPVDTNGTTQVDVSNAKGNLTSLTDYLRVAHNDDGTLKTSPATAIDEFKDNALAITYVSTSSFTVPTNLTGIFTVNRKVKVYLDTSTAISYVSSSSYDSGANKTTVVLGDNVLNSSVTAVKYSVIQYGERQDTVHTSDLSTYAPPVGSGNEYYGDTAPAGYLLCDGSAVSRTTYANLFAIIGTKFGTGNGTTTFNLPDRRHRVGIGLDSTDSDFATLGATGGEKTHTLSIDEMPSHNHATDAQGAHSHTVSAGTYYGSHGSSNVGLSGGDSYYGNGTVNTNATGSHGHNITVAGGGAAHNNMQPYIVVNYIIKY